MLVTILSKTAGERKVARTRLKEAQTRQLWPCRENFSRLTSGHKAAFLSKTATPKSYFGHECRYFAPLGLNRLSDDGALVNNPLGRVTLGLTTGMRSVAGHLAIAWEES